MSPSRRGFCRRFPMFSFVPPWRISMFPAGSRCLAVTTALMLTAAFASAQDAYTPIPGWDHQLFPSYLIATATVHLPSEDEVNDDSESGVRVLGDRQGVLGVELTSDEADTDVTVTIMANAVLEESSLDVTLDEDGTTYRIFPRIRYKYDVLAKNKQSVPIE